MTLLQKIGTGLVTAGLMTGMFATSVSAKVPSVNSSTLKVTQTTNTVADTWVVSKANSGKNVVVDPTYGKHKSSSDPSITTGTAKSDVSVTVSGGSNDATVDPCGCQSLGVSLVTPDEKHKGNSVTTTNKTTVNQTSNTVADTAVYSSANSGGNVVVGSTGGDVSIDTGKAVSNVSVDVSGGSNSLNI